MELADMTGVKPIDVPLPLSHPLYEKNVHKNGNKRDTGYSLPAGPWVSIISGHTHPSCPRNSRVYVGKISTDINGKALEDYCGSYSYLIGTIDCGVLFSYGQMASVEAWLDADWACDHHKRRYSSEYLLNVAGSPVVWASRLQTLMAQ